MSAIAWRIAGSVSNVKVPKSIEPIGDTASAAAISRVEAGGDVHGHDELGSHGRVDVLVEAADEPVVGGGDDQAVVHLERVAVRLHRAPHHVLEHEATVDRREQEVLGGQPVDELAQHADGGHVLAGVDFLAVVVVPHDRARRERPDERVGIAAVERSLERVDHLFVGGHASLPSVDVETLGARRHLVEELATSRRVRSTRHVAEVLQDDQAVDPEILVAPHGVEVDRARDAA